MADVTQLRFGSVLKRVFAIKGADPGRTLSPEMVPSIEVQDQYQPENRSMRGERVWGIGVQLANTITLFQWATICNPVASGRMCIVRRATFSGVLPTATTQPGNVGVFVDQPQISSEGLVLKANWADARQLGTPGFNQSPIGYNLNYTVVNASVNGEAGQSIWHSEIFPGAATAPWYVQTPDLDVVLPPGTTLHLGVRSSVLATAGWNYSVSIQGIEKQFDASELIIPP